MEQAAPPRGSPDQPSFRPTRAEVDLGAVTENLAALKRVSGKPVLAVVKADAYGHGLTRIATRLEQGGVFGFGVALAEEGLALRRAGIRSTILVLSGAYSGAYREAIEARLTPAVHSLEVLQGFDAAADAPLDVHLKIDTGMRRLGFCSDDLSKLLEALKQTKNVRVRGVFTHLASADLDKQFTDQQLARFASALSEIRARGHKPNLVHASNSFGSLLVENEPFDLVRPGIALYGVWPSTTERPSLRPAMRVRTEIIALREVRAGESVGYDRTYVAREGRTVATIPIGYGDGYPWRASNLGEVLLRETRCPILGRVSMDLCSIDVSHLKDVAVGEEVVMFGRQGKAEITIEELAERTGELPYAILTGISSRVPRVYPGSPVGPGASPAGAS